MLTAVVTANMLITLMVTFSKESGAGSEAGLKMSSESWDRRLGWFFWWLGHGAGVRDPTLAGAYMD